MLLDIHVGLCNTLSAVEGCLADLEELLLRLEVEVCGSWVGHLAG